MWDTTVHQTWVNKLQITASKPWDLPQVRILCDPLALTQTILFTDCIIVHSFVMAACKYLYIMGTFCTLQFFLMEINCMHGSWKCEQVLKGWYLLIYNINKARLCDSVWTVSYQFYGYL